MRVLPDARTANLAKSCIPPLSILATAYALAADAHEELLFNGDDFGKTDIICAIPRVNQTFA